MAVPTRAVLRTAVKEGREFLDAVGKLCMVRWNMSQGRRRRSLLQGAAGQNTQDQRCSVRLRAVRLVAGWPLHRGWNQQRVARQQPAGLYLLPVAGGALRRLTTPKVVTAQAPAFSRDGRRLAYASCVASINSACDVYVLDLDTAFTPVGQARRLTSQGAVISGLTWSRNGQSIIYDAQAIPGLTYLWSVDVAGHDQPVRLEVAGVRSSEPATVRDLRSVRSGFERHLLRGCEPRSDPPVYLLNPATGEQRLLGQLEKLTQSLPGASLGVSPDGTRVLYTRDASNGADLMMIDNFR
jgi:Tol biopolymer transport system component